MKIVRRILGIPAASESKYYRRARSYEFVKCLPWAKLSRSHAIHLGMDRSNPLIFIIRSERLFVKVIRILHSGQAGIPPLSEKLRGLRLAAAKMAVDLPLHRLGLH